MAENIVKLRVDGKDFDQNIKSARQGLLAMEQACRKVGGTLEVVEKDELDFVKALGKMETTSKSAKGKIAELTSAFTDLKAQYNRLTDAEKNSPFGKALSQSLNELKGRINASTVELKGIQGELGNTGGSLQDLAGKFGINIGALAKFTTASAAVTAAMKITKDAFLATEGGIDTWGRAVQSAQGAYDVFLQTINGGNWSNFFQNLNDAIGGARELYDKLDRLGSIKSNNQAAIALKESALAEARLQLREAQKNKDAKEITRLQGVIGEYSKQLSVLKGQEVTAGKEAGRAQVSNSIRNSINGNNTTGVNINDATIQRVVDNVMKGGQSYMDYYARKAKELQAKGTKTIHDGVSASGQQNTHTEFDLSLLTKEQQKQYLIAKAVTDKETEIQKGITTYAQAVQVGSQNANQQFKYDRWQGAGGTGTVTMPKFDTTAFTNDSYLAKSMAYERKTAEEDRQQKLKAALEVGLTPEANEKALNAMQSIQDAIAESLANVVLLDIQIDPEAQAKVEDALAAMAQSEQLKNVSKHAQGVSSALSAASSAFSQYAGESEEAAAAQKAFTIAAAIATLVGQFAAIPKGVEIWSWIAGTIAGTATLIATIAQIKSSTNSYAEGGWVGGSSGGYVGDAVPAFLNRGEYVMTQSDVETANNNLQSAQQNAGGGGRSTISGEQIVTVVNAYGRRTGRGEILR